MKNFDILVILPAYNEAAHITKVISAIQQHHVDVVVVDDGSTDGTPEQVRQTTTALVIEHPVNGGKGEALKSGFEYAMKHQYKAVITMDADGQHAADEIPLFIEKFKLRNCQAVLGNRMNDVEGMPGIRKLTNKFMSKLLSKIMGQDVPDTQNGYRLYSAEVLPLCMTRAKGFAAESEVLLALSEAGHKIGSVPVKTVYGDEESKINPLPDTIRFFRMLRKYWFRKRFKQN